MTLKIGSSAFYVIILFQPYDVGSLASRTAVYAEEKHFSLHAPVLYLAFPLSLQYTGALFCKNT